MTRNTKIILGAVGIYAVVYYAYMRKKQGKSISPFGKSSSFVGDDGFFNMTSAKVPPSCKVYAGNVSTSLIGTRVGDGIIVATGTGTTVVCPEGATSIMPIKY